MNSRALMIQTKRRLAKKLAAPAASNNENCLVKAGAILLRLFLYSQIPQRNSSTGRPYPVISKYPAPWIGAAPLCPLREIAPSQYAGTSLAAPVSSCEASKVELSSCTPSLWIEIFQRVG